MYDSNTIERCADVALRRITGDGCDACRAAALIAKEIRELPRAGDIDRETAFDAMERVIEWISARQPAPHHDDSLANDIRTVLRYFGANA